jgi:hypothetical protein
MHLSQISELVFYWQILDSHEDFVVDLLVIRVDLKNEIKDFSVQNWQHQGWLLCKPDRQSWVLGTQMGENDRKALFVVHAHFMDLVFINVHLSLFIFVVLEELSELSRYELLDLNLLEPLRKWTLDVFEVKEVIVVVATSCISVPSKPFFSSVSVVEHDSHSLTSHLLVKDFVVLIVDLVVHEGADTSVGHGDSLPLLSIQIIVHLVPSRQTELVLALVINTHTLILIELRVRLVIRLHVIDNVLTVFL